MRTGEHYHALSIEFKLLQAHYFNELAHRISCEKAELQKWVYMFSAQAKPDMADKYKAATDSVVNSVLSGIDVYIGNPSKVKATPQETTKSQMAYLEALGDKPFSSLDDIIQAVVTLNTTIKS